MMTRFGRSHRLQAWFLQALTPAALALTLTALPHEAAAKRRGPYRGINPGVVDTVKGKTNVRPTRRNLVTWVGFRMEGDQGRVFIKTTAPARYTLAPGARDEVIVELENARLQSRNDGRRLDTTAFPTAVASVNADQRRGNVTRITIKLRTPGPYDMKQEGNYLFLDFRPPAMVRPSLSTPAAPMAAPTEAADPTTF